MSIQRSTTLRYLFWGGALLFLVLLGVRDLQFDRTIEASVDTKGNTATSYLSALGPPARVDVGNGIVRFVGEPVYTELRVPRWFDRVVVELQYENPHELPLRFGLRTHPTIWQFDVKTVEGTITDGANEGTDEADTQMARHPDVEFREEAGVRVARIPLDLNRSWQVNRNVYRFIFSVPGVSPESPLVLHSMRVTAQRDTICIASFCI